MQNAKPGVKTAPTIDKRLPIHGSWDWITATRLKMSLYYPRWSVYAACALLYSASVIAMSTAASDPFLTAMAFHLKR